MDSENSLMSRAMSAYFKYINKVGALPLQPNQGMSGTEIIDGRTYVVLRNVNGIMAVYRLTRQGQLKMLKRWPKQIQD